MSAPTSPVIRYATHDDGTEVFDEFFASKVTSVHFEAMGRAAWWIGIEVGDRMWHINVGAHNDRVRSYADITEDRVPTRQPSPAADLVSDSPIGPQLATADDVVAGLARYADTLGGHLDRRLSRSDVTDVERFDLQAEQRYRSMTGMDLPRNERAQRAHERAARHREEPEIDLDTLTETLARSMLRHSAFRLAPWDGLTDAGRQRWLNKARPIAEDVAQWHTVRPNEQSALACEIGRVLNSSTTSKESTE